MEFEEMQVIWNKQNDEKLYAIDEAALHLQIRRKGRSVERSLDFIEFMMIGLNFVVAVVLFVDAVRDSGGVAEYLFAALYLGYSLISLWRRSARRREDVRFDATMLGELDKALWQANYLVRQARAMIVWYLSPLLLAAAVVIWLNGRPLLALALPLVLFPLTYLAGRWEIRKFYAPKKRTLEAMREALLATPPQSE